MADKIISDFTEATVLDDNDWLEIENTGGNSRKIRASLVKAGMVLLDQEVLASSAATIDFSGIPATFEDLILVLMARGTNASTSVVVQMTYNNDSAGNYDGEKFHYYSTGLGNTQYTAQAFATFCEIPGSTAPSGAVGSARLELPAYARTTFHKAGFVNWANKIGTGTFSQGIGQYGHAWRSTSAVNRIILSLSAGSFDTGTVASLYGRI